MSVWLVLFSIFFIHKTIIGQCRLTAPLVLFSIFFIHKTITGQCRLTAPLDLSKV